MMAKRATSAADKMRQASESNHTKSQILAARQRLEQIKGASGQKRRSWRRTEGSLEKLDQVTDV